MAKLTSKTEGIIESYRKELGRMGIKVDKLFLYGSYARNRAHEGSDIDLVVISGDFKKMKLLERMEKLGIAAGRIGEPVQSYGFTPEEIEAGLIPSFLREVFDKEAVAV